MRDPREDDADPREYDVDPCFDRVLAIHEAYRSLRERAEALEAAVQSLRDELKTVRADTLAQAVAIAEDLDTYVAQRIKEVLSEREDVLRRQALDEARYAPHFYDK